MGLSVARKVAALCVVWLFLSLFSPVAVSAGSTSNKWFGALQIRTGQEATLRVANLNAVTLELGWDAFEPSQGVVNKTYVGEQRLRLDKLRRAGFSVFLDLGLQYPPAWVFKLNGATRLVNQDGVEWRGGTGTNLVNAVFNPAVRAAQSEYYSLVAAAFPKDSFAAIRVGGLHMGELSYPPPNGKSNTMWMYDQQAQAASPVPGWRPGRGTRNQARLGLKYYFDSINGYASWLLSLSSRNFPSADLQLLLPSWGLRPGQIDAALAAELRGTTSAEINGLITQGLDWTSQVNLLIPYGSRGVAYTTWLDAESGDQSLQYMSPADYLYTLTTSRGLALGGENTGGGNQRTLQICLDRVTGLRMRGMMWMNADSLISDAALRQTYSSGARAALNAG